MAIINYVQLSPLSAGGEIWKVQTVQKDKVSGTRSNIVVASTQGLFTSGENQASGTPRTYSDGSVLDPSPRYAGKTITVSYVIYGNNETVKNVLKGLTSFLKRGNFTLSTDFPHSYSVQYQGATIEENFKDSSSSLTYSATFSAKEAF